MYRLLAYYVNIRLKRHPRTIMWAIRLTENAFLFTGPVSVRLHEILMQFDNYCKNKGMPGTRIV